MSRLVFVSFFSLVNLFAFACAAGREARPTPGLRLRVAADLHAHLTMHQSLFFFSGEPGSGIVASSPGQSLVNPVDAEGLQAAGIVLIGASTWPPPALRPGRNAREEAVVQLRRIREFAADVRARHSRRRRPRQRAHRE